VATNYVMKVSSNGQVSIPAETRTRWMTDRVVVVDLGDRIVMRPLPDNPVGELVGKYGGRGPTATAASLGLSRNGGLGRSAVAEAGMAA